jgi:hypothetical protein
MCFMYREIGEDADSAPDRRSADDRRPLRGFVQDNLRWGELPALET